MTTANVTECARCGEAHNGLEFHQFSRPFREDNGTLWEHWATCPVTHEPMLLRDFQRLQAQAEPTNEP